MNEPITRAEKVKAEPRDWEILHASSPEDYTGTTGFGRMDALQRIRWLDVAVEFVARQKAPLADPGT